MSRRRRPLRWALLAAAASGCFTPTGTGPGTATTTTDAATSLTPTSTTTDAATSTAAPDPTTGPAPTTTGAPDLGVPGGKCAALSALDLEDGLGGFVIRPEGAAVGTGYAVTGIGDFDGDGRDDLRVLAMPTSEPDCASQSEWRNYLVHGKADGAAIDLDSGPASTFVSAGQGRYIDGTDTCLPPCSHQFGLTLAGVGDLDGDARADLVVGAPFASAAAGELYVFYGRPPDGKNLLAADVILDPKDHSLVGEGSQLIGYGVAGLGDLDGDGIGDYGFHSGGLLTQRKIHVRYGGPVPANDPYPFILSATPLDGFALIDPEPAEHRDIRQNLRGGHDFTGDGVPDFLFDTGPADAERIVVVPGVPSRTPIDASLDDLLAQGNATLVQCSALCGYTARFVGDINGDGIADLAAGELEFDTFTGRVVVVFGATVARVVAIDDLAASDGFVVVGESGGDFFGNAVAGADLNADGIDDLVIGAPGFDGNRGRVYVAFGGPDLHEVSLPALVAGVGGFVIDGSDVGETTFGASLDRAGRIDDDAIDDLVIGAPALNPVTCQSNEAIGRAYVVFGGSCPG